MSPKLLPALIFALLLALASPSPAEVVQQHGIRVSFQGNLMPKRLPRHGTALVHVAVAARIAGAGGSPPPLLRRIEIAINRHGHFEPSGLPLCSLREIQPTTNADALRTCHRSLIGEGQFSAQVGFTGQAPFPSDGKILAFNGTYDGAPAILAHVFGTLPVPTSYTIPFQIISTSGTYGTVLRASFPNAAGNSGYITGISLTLGRSFSHHGHPRSYLSAGCPAPQGFPGAVFPFARATFTFTGGASLSSTESRQCQALG
jgi:hypothetical protein